MPQKLHHSFYQNPDVVQIANDLLGKVLCTRIEGHTTQAIITETEAYAGETDKASHAYGGRRTKRTEVIYAAGGRAYIYLCYGIHHLFNVVTNIEGVPHAVLIRAGRAVTGEATMLSRRKKTKPDKSFLAGPGSLASALGITTGLTNTDLSGHLIWIENQNIATHESMITAGPRIGIDYAGEDAKLPYRFILGV